MNRLTRVALQLVPASWRDEVENDLDEELRASGRRGISATLWAIKQTLIVAFRLRPAMTGDVLMSDLRFAIRQLGRTPVFTVSAILTLALGLGLNVAAFSVADGILFKPLPYGEPERLVMIRGWNRQTSTPYMAVPQPVIDAVRSGAATIEGIAVRDQINVPPTLMTSDGPPFRTLGLSVNALDVLRVRPDYGRGFVPGDEKITPTPVLLSAAAWRSRFGGDPAIVDRVIALPRQSVQIVGVLPDGLVLPGVTATRAYDMVLPAPAAGAAGRGGVGLFARLRPGATIAAADVEMNQAIDQARRAGAPGVRAETVVQVAPLQFALTQLRRPAVITLFVAAALVMLVATTSITILLLSRGVSRRGELAVRVALGASRARVARLLATETTLVALAGGALGVVIAIVTFRAVTEIVPPDYRVFMSETVNVRMLAFGCLGMVIAGVMFAVSAALAGSRADLRPTLERAGRGRGAFRAGGWLLGAQAAVAIVVIVGAVFMVTSFRRLASVDLGFEPEGLYRAALMGPIAGEPPAGLRARYDALMDRLAARQDLTVAAADSLPWTGEAPLDGMRSGNVDIALRGVSAGFLDVNRARLVSGRWPTADEFRALARVGVINHAGAAALWPGQPAVGQVLTAPQSGPYEVVGVVDDLRSRHDTGAPAELFVPLDLNRSMGARFLVRSSRTAAELTTPLTEAARSANPAGRATVVLTPAADDLDSGLRLPRLVAGVFALFAVIVLVVSAVGITGLLMYFVEQRRYEMGVRLALGASRRAVSRLVTRRALLPVAAGLAVGLGAAWWASRFVESLFFEIRSTDVRLYLAAVAILAGLAFAAAIVPARRASRVDPLIVMRAE